MMSIAIRSRIQKQVILYVLSTFNASSHSFLAVAASGAAAVTAGSNPGEEQGIWDRAAARELVDDDNPRPRCPPAVLSH